MINELLTYLAASPIALTLVGLAAGVIADQAINVIREKTRFRRELKENANIDVTGTWYAAWQTTLNGVEKHNVEAVKLVQRGQTVQINNTEKAHPTDGGYFWSGQMQFLQGRSLMGWYFPTKEENSSSRGIVYFTYFSQMKVFFGQWVGSAHDGDLQSGMAVIATDKEAARIQLSRLIEMSPGRNVIIGYAFGSNGAGSTTPKVS